MKRTTNYLIAIAILLAANLGLVFTEGMQRSASFDDSLFSVSNIEEISSITINNKQGNVLLKKEADRWMLNETMEADRSFLQVLFSILNQVKVKRVVGTLDQPMTGGVTLNFNNGDQINFDFATDDLGTRSYFSREGESYQVEVPGYRDNVANIFGLSADQWRSRVVFDGSWRTIQKLTLTGEKEFTIRFSNQFFVVDGLSAIDSSGVVDYLNQFQIFQANEMISIDQFPELDSLVKTKPLAKISIEDIQKEGETTFEIYPVIANQSYHLVTKNGESPMVFDRRRIQALLKGKEDFAVK